MQRVSSFWARWWRTVVLFLVAVAVVVGDQFSKDWIRANLAVGESLPETGFFCLVHLQNTGAAWGMLQDHTELLTVASFIGVAAVMIYNFYICRRYPVLENGISKAAIGAVLGGTVGNLIDRLQLGYVTDFLSVGSFAKFNVADASITTGISIFAGFLIYLMVKEKYALAEEAPADRSGDNLRSAERGESDTHSQKCQPYRQ